ncbi:MAG: hypothetical protein ABEI96_01005 [Haloarculaceae archaeon]
MSDSESHEKVTVSSDGVTVDKRFEADEFPVPAIAFEIRSEREESATIRLVDDVPDDVAVDDLGFHPEYGSELWTTEDDEITFERDIDPGEEYTTVYGIRATGTDDVEQFLTEPDIETVESSSDDGASAVVDESGTDVVRDVISGDSDSVPGLDDADDEEIETLDLKDPNGDEIDGGPSDTATADDDETDSGTDVDDAGVDGDGNDADADDANTDDGERDHVSVSTTDDESIAAETLTRSIAEEMRNGTVAGEDIKLLRRAFELAGKEGGSVDARLQQLQTDVADLRSYMTALEEFLDDNGTGQQLIEELRADIDDIESDVADVEARTAANSEAVEDLEASVDEMGDVQQAVDDLDDRVDAIDDDVESQLQDLQSDIEELQTWREQLSSVIGGAE